MKKLLFISYGIFLALVVLFSYVFIDPGLLYLKIFFTNFFQLHRLLTTSLFVAIVFLFFLFYIIFLYLIKQNKLSKTNIFGLIAISTFLLLFAYPAMLSFDIFNYIATAKVAFFYHENPYIIMPIEFTHDPLLLFMHAANKTALYAFFWILLTGIPYLLGFGNFLLILFNFKFLAVIFYGATVWLIWKITKNLFQTSFFALNPLVLIEVIVEAHNDIAMMFLLLVSFYFLFSKNKGKSMLFFLLSLLIKYASAILAPLYLWHFIKPLPREKFLKITTILLYCIFFLSAFREEIYPWYALWFLLPVSLQAKDNFLTWISAAFSFSLLLRYIPFMLLGTYFGPTPLLKVLLMDIPILFVFIFFYTKLRKRIV